MQVPEHIFRTYDIRGLLDEVTPGIARTAGQVLVRMTGAKTVVVGRDMRATSPELARAAIEGITAMGVDVIDIGMATTPYFSFAVQHLHAGAGLMVTASHNPPEYNGMKFADAHGLPISGKQILPMMSDAFEESATHGSVRTDSPLDAYLDACSDWPGIDLVRGAKIVADFGNGMGAMTIRPLAKRLGVELIEMFPEPDARFPNHEANPAKEETLEAIKREVVRQGADFGIALDGDADRIGFIDNEGVSLRGDLALVLFAEDVLAQSPGARIVTSPNQSWMTTDSIVALGGVTEESAIGRTLVIHKMAETGAALSGEVSSHFFFKEFGNLEAVEHAFVRLLVKWKTSKKTFADMVRPLRVYANSGEINFQVPDKAAAIARLVAAYSPQATKVNTLDGIRCDFDREWWFIVRPSNNEPLIRLIVEANSEQRLQDRVQELTKLLQEVGAIAVLTH